ncbi:MAG: class I SAM-dependent methyltransferase, partial [Synergistaceae bacterium]|nr:class I SAM-dependent methyltransferase [Synergistaceae bacterium]
MNFVPERYETECLDRIDGQIAGASMMSRDERLFINGLVRRFKPKKVLEVGVSMGGGTCVLLNAVGDDPDAVVHSVDWSERYYMDSSKITGWKASELFAGTPKWRPHLGYDVSEVIEEIGGGVDFVVLDTVHWHPGETLSFISVFPFLTRD